jgi:hypothetical protein
VFDRLSAIAPARDDDIGAVGFNLGDDRFSPSGMPQQQSSREAKADTAHRADEQPHVVASHA